jgi:hypothetical protein
MNDKLFEGVSKQTKLDFLKKLNSGKYKLGKMKQQVPSREFYSLDCHYIYDPVTYHTSQIDHETKTGLYKCVETGEMLTFEQVEALRPEYRLLLYLYGRQMTHIRLENELVTGFRLINIMFPKDQYLNSLLIPIS